MTFSHFAPKCSGMTRLRFNPAKAIQAIDFIARKRPGLTQYYIGKILFFADREHLLDYGRAITGDRYVAMRDGPVPSTVRDILKSDPDYADETLDLVHSHLLIEKDDNKQHVYSKRVGEFPNLSGTDKAYLDRSVEDHADLTYGQLKQLSHDDRAYDEAWSKPGLNNEMNVETWLDDLDQPMLAKEQLRDNLACG